MNSFVAVERAMAAVRRDHQVGLRSCTVQSPGALHGTGHIVTSLHNRAGDGVNPPDIEQQLIVTFEKTSMDKVVGLDNSAPRDAHHIRSILETGTIWH